MSLKTPASRQAALAVALFVLSTFAAHSQAAPPPPATDWAALGRTVTQDLVAGRFAAVEARYHETIKAALPPGKLATIWSGLLQQTGAFREISGVKAQELGPYHVVVATCAFERAALDLRLSFDGEGHLGGLFFGPSKGSQGGGEWTPPPYAQPSAFTERAVTVGSDPWKLPGTLTLPAAQGGPVPVVVLVHGSGPHDADETIGPNRPFKDLAWGLASRGIAVLRYEKRTSVHAEKLGLQGGQFTVQDETVDDARAAVALAAQQPEIDKTRIYVLGHSLGGMLAPRIARSDRSDRSEPQVAGLVILAGSARPLQTVVLDQLRYLAGLAGPDGAAAKAAQDAVREAEESARQIESPQLKPDTPVKFIGATIPGSYFLDLRDYDPPAIAAKLTVPILVLQADKDYQVTGADLEAWKKGLAGRPRVTFKRYPGLYHLFLPSQASGAALGTPADYEHPGHVAEEVIQDIAAWVAGAKP